MSAGFVGLPFVKLSGAGNDFVALVEPDADLDPAAAARTLCRRGLSIGADGLFVLRRMDGTDVAMDHYNADGGAADLCLNGTRCAAALAFDLGWAADTVTLHTGAGPVKAERSGRGVRAEVAPPGPVRRVELGLPEGPRLRGWLCDSGVPHVVFVVGAEDAFAGGALPDHDLDSVDVEGLGAAIREHPDLAPAGANVDFVAGGRSGAEHGLRTFERGVEGETLACGTGALACAAVLRSLDGGNRFVFHTRGGFALEVVVEGSDEPRWFLEGDARIVARGEVEAGAVATGRDDRRVAAQTGSGPLPGW